MAWWNWGPGRRIQGGREKRPAGRVMRIVLPAAVWLGIWQMAALKVGKELLLPAPAAVAAALGGLVGTPAFWQTACVSLLRVFGGFWAGVLLGTALAICTSALPWADWIISPAVRLIRAVPVASFILLILLWSPTGRVPTIISGLMVLPVVWGNVSKGIAQTSAMLLETAQAYRFTPWKTARLVYLPCVLPYFAAGCGTAMGLAWKAGVAAEVLCLPKQAIGSQVYYAKLYLETPALFAWTGVVIALSFLLEYALGALFRQMGRGETR